MAYKAEKIAEKIKKQKGSPMPAMLFHDVAYQVIMDGKEAQYLTKDELKQCEDIEEDKAETIINSLA